VICEVDFSGETFIGRRGASCRDYECVAFGWPSAAETDEFALSVMIQMIQVGRLTIACIRFSNDGGTLWCVVGMCGDS
jgi:hypothetical protein